MTMPMKNWTFEQPVRYGGSDLKNVTAGLRGCSAIWLFESGLVVVEWTNGDDLYVFGRAHGMGAERPAVAELDAAITDAKEALEMIAERDPQPAPAAKPKRDGKRITE